MRMTLKQSLIILTMVLVSFGLAGGSMPQKTGGVQAVLDRIEIKDKMGLYSFAWDEGRPEEFRTFFTEDAVFETWTPRKKAILYKFGSLQEIIDGRKALGAQASSDTAIRHNLSEVTFLELTERTAKTKTIYTFSMFLETNLNEPSLIVSGSYNDTWVKTDKGWLIKNRAIIYDNMPPALAGFAEKSAEQPTVSVKKAMLLLRLPEKYNTPDAMELDAAGNIILSVPNFNSVLAKDKITTETAPAVILSLDKNNRISTWYEFQPADLHPETGYVGPMSIAFGPDGNLYVADNQWFYDTNAKSRLLRINLENGRPANTDILAEGFILANGLVWHENKLFFAETILTPKKENEKLLSAVYMFMLDELKNGTIKIPLYDAKNPDAHILEVFESSGKVGFGADGVTFDGIGNLFTSIVEDGKIYKTTFDADGSVGETKLFAKDNAMLSADGIKWNPADNRIYVADLLGNAAFAVDAQGNVELLHKNEKSDGADGSLDEPSDPIVRGDELILVNMGLTWDDAVYTLSSIPLK